MTTIDFSSLSEQALNDLFDTTNRNLTRDNLPAAIDLYEQAYDALWYTRVHKPFSAFLRSAGQLTLQLSSQDAHDLRLSLFAVMSKYGHGITEHGVDSESRFIAADLNRLLAGAEQSNAYRVLNRATVLTREGAQQQLLITDISNGSEAFITVPLGARFTGRFATRAGFWEGKRKLVHDLRRDQDILIWDRKLGRSPRPIA